MAFTEGQLAQQRNSTTDATSILANTSGRWAIKTIKVCNTSEQEAKFSMYHDEVGTTYDESTALYWEVPIESKETVLFDTYMCTGSTSSNVAYKTSVANALTVTLYGGNIT